MVEPYTSQQDQFFLLKILNLLKILPNMILPLH